jgi:Zn-dependent protease with chaperone function
MKACFDVKQSVTFWKRMANLKNVENKEEVNLNAKNSRNINEYLSTHPSSETRSTHLEIHLENVYF